MAARNSSEATALGVVERHGAVFAALRKILKPYEGELAVKTDKPGNCYLETRSGSINGRPLFFAAAKVKKNYVSFYLPSLYMFPDLSNRISPGSKAAYAGSILLQFDRSGHMIA